MATFAHKNWVLEAQKLGLAKFETSHVSVDRKDGNEPEKIAFDQAEFVINSPEDASKLWTLAEAERADGKENPLATAIGYAYGLNCRSSIRANAMPSDPTKALKAAGKALFKAFPKKYKTEEAAYLAAQAMAEEEAAAE